MDPPNSQRRRRATKNPRTASTLALKEATCFENLRCWPHLPKEKRKHFACFCFCCWKPTSKRDVFFFLSLEVCSQMILFVFFDGWDESFILWIVHDQKRQDKNTKISNYPSHQTAKNNEISAGFAFWKSSRKNPSLWALYQCLASRIKVGHILGSMDCRPIFFAQSNRSTHSLSLPLYWNRIFVEPYPYNLNLGWCDLVEEQKTWCHSFLPGMTILGSQKKLHP